MEIFFFLLFISFFKPRVQAGSPAQVSASRRISNNVEEYEFDCQNHSTPKKPKLENKSPENNNNVVNNNNTMHMRWQSLEYFHLLFDDYSCYKSHQDQT